MHPSRTPLLIFAVALAAAVADPGAASRRFAPQGGGKPIAVLEGRCFSSNEDGPGIIEFALQINSITPGPKGTAFEGTYFDDNTFVVPVTGKLSAKRKFTFAGKGGQLILGRPGAQGVADPDATLSVKFTGQMNAAETLALGTYKNTYKKLEVAPTDPYKDIGGWYLQDE